MIKAISNDLFENVNFLKKKFKNKGNLLQSSSMLYVLASYDGVSGLSVSVSAMETPSWQLNTLK